jgi:membrane-associated protein
LELIHQLIDLFLHLDKHLAEVVGQYGLWTYFILFTIVFCETGLVVTPFLPGDSLLFAAGSLAALDTGGSGLNVTYLLILLSVAAIIGDTVNYWVGAYIGPRAFSGNVRFLKKEYLDRTHRFYEKHGGKTIILARFIPIIRTFAPFVAGIGAMSYGRFLVYNVVGGIGWVAAFVCFGYFFGSIPWVKEHFSVVVLAIIVISVLPLVVEVLRTRFSPTTDATSR